MGSHKSYTIEDLKAYAKSQGGECLSKWYKSLDKKYKWRCKNGHTWFATASSVMKHNHWCAQCAGHGGRLYEYSIHTVVSEWGGSILSEKYNSGNLSFRCMMGHEFKASPSAVMHGKWCPVCKKNAKAVMIAWRLRKVTERRGGKILTPYADIRHMTDYVRLECKHGHIFSAKISNLHYLDSWCPECAREARRRKPAKDKK